MIDPHGLTLRQWADAVILATRGAWSTARLDDEANWQDWAAGFALAGNFTQQTLPDPYAFADWREWAMRAYPMLEET